MNSLGRVRAQVRRHRTLCAVGAVWVLMAAVLPTVQPAFDGFAGSSGRRASGALGGEQVTADGGYGTALPAGGGAGSASASGVGGRAAKGGAAATRTVSSQALGRTRGGVECRPGVKQIPDSDYAAPCVPVFTGNNGGATSRGVTGTTIRLADRFVDDTGPTAQAYADFNQRAGLGGPDDYAKVRATFLDYFNRTYEVYGRHVEITTYHSTHGQSIEEQTNGNRSGACADATDITDTVKAFAVTDSDSIPFADCAAEHKLVVLNAALQAPESFFADRHPYLWSIPQDCDRLAYQLAEYAGKRLVGRRARWAGDASFRARTRKFGIYMPDDEVYQPCLDLALDILRRQYGVSDVSVYKFQLDAARLADQSQQAILQFKAGGVTSVVLADDPLSTQFLTQGAAAQGYRPEWILSGTSGVDIDGAARQYDQSEVAGHMFGRTPAPRAGNFVGPQAEPNRLYRRLTGKELPAGAGDGGYWSLLVTFNLLQAAGPVLTPAALAHAWDLPDTAGRFLYASFTHRPDGSPGHDHTIIDDNEEIYWAAGAPSPDGSGKKGTFLPTYGERRFRNGEWPAEEPQVYP